MQRDNPRKRENDETAVKAGISPSSYCFPSALSFRHHLPHCRLLLLYYSAEVYGLKAWLLRYIKKIFLNCKISKKCCQYICWRMISIQTIILSENVGVIQINVIGEKVIFKSIIHVLISDNT